MQEERDREKGECVKGREGKREMHVEMREEKERGAEKGRGGQRGDGRKRSREGKIEMKREADRG